jgi:hypothetical protein
VDIREATQNVHFYEKEINRLERLLEGEIVKNRDLVLDVLEVKREFADFKHNQYEALQEKYDHEIDYARSATVKYDQ